MDPNKTGRDHLLDFAKGVAILLVVVGHTFQGQSERFDDLLGFRVIYSFHMPFFAFLSGAAAAHWLAAYDATTSFATAARSSLKRIMKAAVGLLVPFVSWTAIAFWAGHSQESAWDYSMKVFKQPDYSLWFLPCIFWCTTFVALYAPFASRVESIIRLLTQGTLTAWPSFHIQLGSLFVIWLLVRDRLPTEFGLIFANKFSGGLFIYFLLGILLFNSFSEVRNRAVRALPYVIFLALVPFWYRVAPLNPYLPEALKTPMFVQPYAFVVALAGTLMSIDISRIIFASHRVNAFVCLLGKSSIGIYAAHFYFLGDNPPVLTPLLVSVAIYQLVLLVPVARTLLFGKLP